MAQTAAHVDIDIQDNATFTDAFQFGTAGDTSWSFTGQNFRLDVKGDEELSTTLLSLTSAAGQIIVSDAVNRILYFSVPESVIQGALIPGKYEYDFIMFDNSNPAIRVPLMEGHFTVHHGITGG